MQETWRWYGEPDPIPLAHVRQTGATGIVTLRSGHNKSKSY